MEILKPIFNYMENKIPISEKPTDQLTMRILESLTSLSISKKQIKQAEGLLQLTKNFKNDILNYFKNDHQKLKTDYIMIDEQKLNDKLNQKQVKKDKNLIQFTDEKILIKENDIQKLLPEKSFEVNQYNAKNNEPHDDQFMNILKQNQASNEITNVQSDKNEKLFDSAINQDKSLDFIIKKEKSNLTDKIIDNSNLKSQNDKNKKLVNQKKLKIMNNKSNQLNQIESVSTSNQLKNEIVSLKEKLFTQRAKLKMQSNTSRENNISVLQKRLGNSKRKKNTNDILINREQLENLKLNEIGKFKHIRIENYKGQSFSVTFRLKISKKHMCQLQRRTFKKEYIKEEILKCISQSQKFLISNKELEMQLNEFNESIIYLKNKQLPQDCIEKYIELTSKNINESENEKEIENNDDL